MLKCKLLDKQDEAQTTICILWKSKINNTEFVNASKYLLQILNGSLWLFNCPSGEIDLAQDE